jgi:hypothetical protein
MFVTRFALTAFFQYRLHFLRSEMPSFCEHCVFKHGTLIHFEKPTIPQQNSTSQRSTCRAHGDRQQLCRSIRCGGAPEHKLRRSNHPWPIHPIPSAIIPLFFSGFGPFGVEGSKLITALPQLDFKTKFLFCTPNNLLPNIETVTRTQA